MTHPLESWIRPCAFLNIHCYCYCFSINRLSPLPESSGRQGSGYGPLWLVQEGLQITLSPILGKYLFEISSFFMRKSTVLKMTGNGRHGALPCVGCVCLAGVKQLYRSSRSCEPLLRPENQNNMKSFRPELETRDSHFKSFSVQWENIRYYHFSPHWQRHLRLKSLVSSFWSFPLKFCPF